MSFYGDTDYFLGEEQPEPEYLYWFADSKLLCTLENDGSFFVLNGAWQFDRVNGRCLAYVGNLLSDNSIQDLGAIEKPKAMTRRQFDKLHPHFGY